MLTQKKKKRKLTQCCKPTIRSLLSQSCPTLRDPMDCSPPGSSVHELFQARILEWVAISFSRVSSQPGIEPGSHALQADSLKKIEILEMDKRPGLIQQGGGAERQLLAPALLSVPTPPPQAKHPVPGPQEADPTHHAGFIVSALKLIIPTQSSCFL